MSSGPVSLERRNERADVLRWCLAIAVALLAAWLTVRLHAGVGSAAAPFSGRYRLTLTPRSVLAPLLAVGLLVAVARGWTDRTRFPVLLAGAYVAAVGWALSLATVEGWQGLSGPLTDGAEYLADVVRVGTAPGTFVRDFTAHLGDLTPATRDHPPLPVLLLWLLVRAGVHSPAALGVVLTLLGSLAVPLVLIAVRSLAGEAAARRLAPLLVLAPYAVWVAVSMDGVTAALGAGVVAAGALGSERGRRWWTSVAWAALAGLLLGVAALFSYAAPCIAVSVMCLYFVRRRPLLNVVSAAATLLPLLVAHAAGFGWTDGLAAAREDILVRLAPSHSVTAWAVLAVALLLICCGPALVASARKVRLTPAWPYLVGAAAGVVFAVVAGLARGEMERGWLPFFPWLLVAAVAPERRGGEPPAPLLWLAGAGAVTGVVVQAVLASPW
jgi:methylthioxylose transferase